MQIKKLNFLICFLTGLFIISLVPGVTAANDSGMSKTPVYVITNISLDKSDLSASPGTSISPIITVQNKGGEIGADLLAISATLGPKSLINNNGAVKAPGSGKTETYALTLTLPSIPPGEYPLTVSISSPGTDKGSGLSTMKAKSLILVSQPQPAQMSDCGCSS